MAKAYTNTPSLVDLDLLEDDDELSDCRSLDSFFDDDFDEESASRHEEKLQDLLSCNTLGIESKVGLVGQKHKHIVCFFSPTCLKQL